MINKDVSSIGEVSDIMKRQSEAYDRAMQQALFAEASLVMDLSQIQCPEQFGPLRASGRVDLPVSTTGKITITLGYHTKYAVYVHENIDAVHFTTPFTKAKYLEDPVNFYLPGFVTRVNERMLDMIKETMV